jgi:hypothetical protein
MNRIDYLNYTLVPLWNKPLGYWAAGFWIGLSHEERAYREVETRLKRPQATLLSSDFSGEVRVQDMKLLMAKNLVEAFEFLCPTKARLFVH